MTITMQSYGLLLSTCLRRASQSTMEVRLIFTARHLGKCLDADYNSLFVPIAYWIDDRLQIISAPLIQQLPVCISLKIDNGKSKLSDCLTVLVECTDDTSLLKSINLGTLLHTRSENVRLRLYALSCSVALWQSHSKKLSGKFYTVLYNFSIFKRKISYPKNLKQKIIL